MAVDVVVILIAMVDQKELNVKPNTRLRAHVSDIAAQLISSIGLEKLLIEAITSIVLHQRNSINMTQRLNKL